MDKTKYPALYYAFILAGVVLSFVQFFYNRSLFVDEASLALNIINRNFSELLKPLDHEQIAPIGFLWVEKIFVLLLGKNEFSLRIFLLISFLLSIPLIYFVAHQLTRNKQVALLSASFFSLTILLLTYSSEAKQYMSDVLFSLLIFSAALSFNFTSTRSLIIFALVGCVSIFMSNVSLIILFVSGIFLLYSETYRKQNYKLLSVFLLWGVAFLFYYFSFIRNHPAKDFMVSFWKEWNGFMPANPFSGSFWKFIYFHVKDIYSYLLGYGKSLWIAPFLISFYVVANLLWRKNFKVLFLLSGPVLCHLLLSGFELYPFSARIILYTAPFFIIILATGIVHLVELINKHVARIPGYVALLPVIVMLYVISINFPIEKEEIKKSLSYMDKKIGKGEIIYIYYASQNAFDFYKLTGVVKNNNPVISGQKHRHENEKYNSQLLMLKGKAWLLFSHVYPFYPWTQNNEEKYMIDFLLKNGGKLLDRQKFKDSSVYQIKI